ncbi:MAG: hypothetical protein HZC45_08730 [Deltaproteobacteria bacterium]|nr:hypothetical protein [Deltaproteobacteria bacterium]
MNRIAAIFLLTAVCCLSTAAFIFAETPQNRCEDTTKEMLDAIKKRGQELDEREEKVRLEEDKLNGLKAEIDEKINELTRARKELEKTLKEMKTEKQQGMENLVKVYENMPPEEAASRIEKLDEDMAIRFLMTMKTKSAAKILSFVEPSKAAKLTQKLGNKFISAP